jgi:hypothetical protein
MEGIAWTELVKNEDILEGMGRRRRKRKQLLDDLKETRIFW